MQADVNSHLQPVFWIILSYFPTLLSTSPLYNHPLSWTPSLPTFPYHPTFLLSYFPTFLLLLSTSSLYYHSLSWTPLSLHIHTPPAQCPPPPYTITHSAGHPPCLPSLTVLLSYFHTLTVHLASLYYHLLSWTPSPRNVNCDSFDSNSDNAAF
jgi:hypothetical protein